MSRQQRQGRRRHAFNAPRLGEVGRAAACFEESLTIQRAQHNMAGMAECLVGFAALAVARGKPCDGARLLAAVTTSGWESQVVKWPATRQEYERTKVQVREQCIDAERQAAQAVSAGLTLESAVTEALRPSAPALSRNGAGSARPLSAREEEVAALIGAGLANGEIADRLVLSKRTVEHHVANILARLNFTKRAEIVRWAIENGVTDEAR